MTTNMKNVARQVTIKVRNVGQSFGCIGIVSDACTGERLGDTDIKPYGMKHVAYSCAETLAEKNGWTVVSGSHG